MSDLWLAALQAARERLERRWAQGDGTIQNPCTGDCLMTALHTEYFARGGTQDGWQELTAFVRQALPPPWTGQLTCEWNDAPERTKRQVLAFVDRLAAKVGAENPGAWVSAAWLAALAWCAGVWGLALWLAL